MYLEVDYSSRLRSNYLTEKWCSMKNYHINGHYILAWRDVLASGRITSICTTMIIIGCLHTRKISLHKLRIYWVETHIRPCNSYWLPTQTFASSPFNILPYSAWHRLTFSTPKSWTQHWSKKRRGRRVENNQKQQQIHQEEQLRQWNLANTNLFCFLCTTCKCASPILPKPYHTNTKLSPHGTTSSKLASMARSP